MENKIEKYISDGETTIAAIIHEWIQEHLEEVEK